MSTNASHARIRALRIGRGIYLFALLAAVAALFVFKRDDIVKLLAGARMLPLAVSFIASFVLIWLGAKFWAMSLRMLGHPLKLNEVLLATARALPVRYVPVGAGFAIGRVALLRASGIKYRYLVATAGIEITVGVTIAFVSGTSILGMIGLIPGNFVWTAIGVLVLGLCLSPVANRGIVLIVQKRINRTQKSADKREDTSDPDTSSWQDISIGARLQLLAVMCVYWIWSSTTFVIYLHAFSVTDDLGILASAGAFMTSWSLGFVAIFAPQGLGVTEISLVTLLTTASSDTVIAATIFGGYRLVHMARDGVASLAAETFATYQTHRRSSVSICSDGDSSTSEVSHSEVLDGSGDLDCSTSNSSHPDTSPLDVSC